LEQPINRADHKVTANIQKSAFFSIVILGSFSATCPETRFFSCLQAILGETAELFKANFSWGQGLKARRLRTS
jgi:hypothetical protein